MPVSRGKVRADTGHGVISLDAQREVRPCFCLSEVVENLVARGFAHVIHGADVDKHIEVCCFFGVANDFGQGLCRKREGDVSTEFIGDDIKVVKACDNLFRGL